MQVDLYDTAYVVLFIINASRFIWYNLLGSPSEKKTYLVPIIINSFTTLMIVLECGLEHNQ
jgi:hypothetical protein